MFLKAKASTFSGPGHSRALLRVSWIPPSTLLASTEGCIRISPRTVLWNFGLKRVEADNCLGGAVDSLYMDVCELSSGPGGCQGFRNQVYFMLGNNASRPEVGLPGRILPDCYRESTEIGPPAGLRAGAVKGASSPAYLELPAPQDRAATDRGWEYTGIPGPGIPGTQVFPGPGCTVRMTD
jgi:hypothetical protein